MFWIKACPKCRGDLYEAADIYGKYIACLQCARYLTEDEQALVETLQTPEDRMRDVPGRLERIAA